MAVSKELNHLTATVDQAMATSYSSYMTVSVSLLVFVLANFSVFASASNFIRDFEVTWGNGRGKILSNGELLTLSLDKASGSGFQSKNEYLFGKIDIQLKLIPGDSAGTVTTYYLSSQGPTRDEIDFEFLGNRSGDPYVLHTNIYTQGKGEREQQFYLWFDPAADFHTYSIIWDSQNIIFSVDDTPIREFKNMESIGVPFPNKQRMKLYSSIWNADDWATRGGLVKTDWTKAPFTVSYRNFYASSRTSRPPALPGRNINAQDRLRRVQKNYMIYNYCTDRKRFPQGPPRECTVLP